MDLVLADSENNLYSLDQTRQRHHETNPDSEFELCSDRMQRKYPGYCLAQDTRFEAGTSIQKIRFTDLKDMLLCKDMNNYEQISRTLYENDKCSFLDASCDLLSSGDSVVFQSFVRSGNTFLRRYLEQITGIWTGTDMGIKFTFHEAISLGLLGQNWVSDEGRVWITKTHFPMQRPDSRHFTANKMIVVARNPIDVIPSFAGLYQLDSHSLMPAQQYHIDYPDFWTEWVQSMTQRIKINHERTTNWISEEIPTYWMRYEDLKLNPQPVLEGLFCFLLNVPSIAGTVVERRIAEVTQSGFENKTAYKLKSTSNSLSRSNHMYTEEQISMMKTELADFIRFWGYDGSYYDQ